LFFDNWDLIRVRLNQPQVPKSLHNTTWKVSRLGIGNWTLAIEISVRKSALLFINGQFSMANTQFPGDAGADYLKASKACA
jgi:hypothetical protein